MKSRLLLPLIVAAILAPVALHAEEGGSGHYLPGATASFIDALPGREAFAYVNAFAYYNGSAGGSRRLNPGGLVAANIDGTVYADSSTLLYQTPWKICGGQYAAAVTIPYWSSTVKSPPGWKTCNNRPFLTGRFPKHRNVVPNSDAVP
jgi:hypothetical protein